MYPKFASRGTAHTVARAPSWNGETMGGKKMALQTLQETRSHRTNNSHLKGENEAPKCTSSNSCSCHSAFTYGCGVQNRRICTAHGVLRRGIQCHCHTAAVLVGVTM